MPRPKKKQIKLEKESVLALMQEIYNECIEQRNTAIRIQNKMLSFMHEAEDLQLLGPVIKEQQKIIDSTSLMTRIIRSFILFSRAFNFILIDVNRNPFEIYYSNLQ